MVLHRSGPIQFPTSSLFHSWLWNCRWDLVLFLSHSLSLSWGSNVVVCRSETGKDMDSTWWTWIGLFSKETIWAPSRVIHGGLERQFWNGTRLHRMGQLRDWIWNGSSSSSSLESSFGWFGSIVEETDCKISRDAQENRGNSKEREREGILLSSSWHPVTSLGSLRSMVTTLIWLDLHNKWLKERTNEWISPWENKWIAGSLNRDWGVRGDRLSTLVHHPYWPRNDVPLAKDQTWDDRVSFRLKWRASAHHSTSKMDRKRLLLLPFTLGQCQCRKLVECVLGGFIEGVPYPLHHNFECGD